VRWARGRAHAAPEERRRSLTSCSTLVLPTPCSLLPAPNSLPGGAAIVVFSLFGLVGACCAFSRDHGWDVACCSNRLLMGYYVAVLLLCACLFYASLLCFLFVDKAKEYLESYWTLISDIYQNEGLELSEVDELVNKYSSAAGGLCIGAIVLNLICAHLSAKVMGYRYTTRRTIMIINLTGFILAVGLLVLAFVPATQEVGVRNGWLPQFVGGLGVFIAVMSLVGFSGAYWDSIGVLAVNGSIQGLLGLIVLIFGALCLSDAKNSGQMLQPVWGLVKERFVDVCPECDLMGAPESPAGETASNGTTTVVVDGERDAAACCADRAALLVWNNLTVLGVALSTILICILVNALSSLYLYRILRRDRMSPLDDEEMEGLRSKRRAFSRMDRRARDDC